jgi:hypothetical protein
MQEQETILTEYSFVSITDAVYHPIFRNGKWYLVGVFPRKLDNIVYLCGIPAEDAVFLKLKYGG